MSVIQYKLNLDLRRDVHQVLVMKEGDVNAREICITVTDNGKVFNLDGYSADCKWKKPDGTYVFNACPARQGQLYILCTRQMLAVSGIARVEIVLYRDISTENQDKNVISTMKFHVSVNPSVVCDKDIESSDEFGALTEIMLKNKQLAKSLEELMEDSTLVHTSDLGVPGGVATLNESGTIPSAQLPSYVDDVKDGHAVHVMVDDTTGSRTASEFIFTGESEPCVPETDKIYIDIDEGITYRWSGTIFVSIGSPLSLGTTSSMAFPGDRGLSLEQAVQDLSSPATWQKNGLLSSEDKKRIDNYANLREIRITLPAASWYGTAAPYTQAIETEDLSVYNNCSIEMDTNATYAQTTAAADAKINRITYENGQLSFSADGTKPSVDLPLLLCVGTSINIVSVPACFEDLTNSLTCTVILLTEYSPNGNELFVSDSYNLNEYKFFYIELIHLERAWERTVCSHLIPGHVFLTKNSSTTPVNVSAPGTAIEGGFAAADIWVPDNNKIATFINSPDIRVQVYGVK